MPKIQVSTILSDDRNQVTLTILEDEKPLAHVILEVPEIEEIIQLLAANRASMAEPVPAEIEPLARLAAIDDPVWRTKRPSNSPKPGVLLALRHPGFGWLPALLPSQEAANLGQSLLDLSREQ